MELVITFGLVAKIVLFVLTMPILALMFLFPINDRPTSGTQVVVWLAVEALVFALLFGFINVKFAY